MTYGRPPLVFDECYIVDPITGCWVWQHGVDIDGYPRYRKQKATRWALINIGGEKPGDWWALHACNNRRCVRPGPGHLYAGTPQENQRDSYLAGTDQAKHVALNAQWAEQSASERRARTAPGVEGIRAWWANRTPEEKSALGRAKANARWKNEMNTFLPYPNLAASAIALDRMRLNQQINECRQILSAIANGGGWRNHPAVKMWRGHEMALRLYHDCCVREWLRRGYKNNRDPYLPPLSEVVMPAWIGREDYHSSHRSQLLMKLPEWYSHFGWTEEPGLPYVWPV